MTIIDRLKEIFTGPSKQPSRAEKTQDNTAENKFTSEGAPPPEQSDAAPDPTANATNRTSKND